MRVYVAHPQGIPYARTLLERIYTSSAARNVIVSVDPDLLGTLIRRFRSAPTSDMPWRLSTDTTHTTAFHSFLGTILSHLTELRQDLFTQIMDIHIDSGTPVSVLEPLINKCMRLHRFPGRWTPAAYNVLILAHRRDGDFHACLDVYNSFRRSLDPFDESWHNYTASTLHWPYESLLTAALESQRSVQKNRYRAPSDMPSRIWGDLQVDGISPPPRLVAYLVKCARHSGDPTSAHRLWNVFFPPTSSSTILASSSTAPAPPASSTPDIDCYYQYLKLLRQPAKGPSVPLRPIIRRLLTHYPPRSPVPTPFIRTTYLEALRTALCPTYADFPLAIWLVDRALLDGDADVVDVLGEGILRHALSKPRGGRWIRTVLGTEFEKHLAGRRKRVPRGIWTRNARSRGVTTRDWDLLSHHLVGLRSSPAEETVYLPLGNPLARWTTMKSPPPPTSSQTSHTAASEDSKVSWETIDELVACLRGILVACLTTRQRGNPSVPVVGTGKDCESDDNGVGEETGGSGERVLRRAMEGLYRDLLG